MPAIDAVMVVTAVRFMFVLSALRRVVACATTGMVDATVVKGAGVAYREDGVDNGMRNGADVVVVVELFGMARLIGNVVVIHAWGLLADM